MNLRAIPRFAWIIAAGVALLAVVVAFDLTPWIRGGYGWRWPRFAAGSRIGPLVVAAPLIVAGGVVLLRRLRRAWPLLLYAIAGSVLIALAGLYAYEGNPGFTLFARTASPGTTGFHWAGAVIDWGSGEWRDWTAVMLRLEGQLATSPPGLPVLYGALNAVMDGSPLTGPLHAQYLTYQCHNYLLLTYTPAEWASAWLGVLMPMWAALTVLPLYALTRRLVDERAARWSALWWMLVPGVASFAASWSTFNPFLSVTAFLVFVIALEKQGRAMIVWLLAAGLLTGIALFLNFVFLPLPGLFGFYTLAYYGWIARKRDDAPPLWWPVGVGVVFGAGMLVPWLIFMLLGGTDPVAMLRTAFDQHLVLERPFWYWSWWHLGDWALFTGVGAFVLWLLGLARWQHRDSPPLLGLALLLTVLVMTLSATTRGESGRIWLFLSPFVIVAALDGLRRLSDGPRAENALVLITAAQIPLTVAIAGGWAVMGTGWNGPPDPPAVAADLRPVDAAFTAEHGAFRLSAWDGVESAGGVRLSLGWEGIERARTPYWIGAFLVAPDGTTTEPLLWQPGGGDDEAGRYPTTCWAQGVRVGESITLPLPADAIPGEWWVSLAVFGAQNQPEGRLPVTFPDGATDVQVGLGPVIVE